MVVVSIGCLSKTLLYSLFKTSLPLISVLRWHDWWNQADKVKYERVVYRACDINSSKSNKWILLKFCRKKGHHQGKAWRNFHWITPQKKSLVWKPFLLVTLIAQKTTGLIILKFFIHIKELFRVSYGEIFTFILTFVQSSGPGSFLLQNLSVHFVTQNTEYMLTHPATQL